MPPGRRSGRAAAKRAAAALESTPRGFADAEDEPMPDADATIVSDLAANQDDEKDEDHQEPPEEREENGNEETASGVKDEEAMEKEPTLPAPPVFRRKRLGRPPKNKPPGWDNMIVITEEEANMPRRRGRGGWRGRGGRKGGAPPPKAEQVIDAEGTIAEIANDECVLPEDAEGETKVDKLGNLQGERDYRCRTFTVLGRGGRLYMLSTEPARCVGFRDSYLFFTKHRKLYKIIVDDDEKKDMIERDIIPHSYKGRSIGIVTARSVFREFGARIVVGGRRVVDDYDVVGARAAGAVEGELADPNDRVVPGEPYNKNQYVAWHGASAVYHTSVPSAPDPTGKPEYRRRRVNVNDTNWMLEHAREASNFNTGINAIRKFNNAGVYDIHTNVMHYPAHMQPTRARIEQISPDEEESVADGSTSGRFPPVPVKVARNFLVMDTYMESPVGVQQQSAAGRREGEKREEEEGSNGNDHLLAAFDGIAAISEDVKKLLPEECRAALEGALERERSWRARWGPEAERGCRRLPIIDKAIVPYSMPS